MTLAAPTANSGAAPAPGFTALFDAAQINLQHGQQDAQNSAIQSTDPLASAPAILLSSQTSMPTNPAPVLASATQVVPRDASTIEPTPTAPHALETTAENTGLSQAQITPEPAPQIAAESDTPPHPEQSDQPMPRPSDSKMPETKQTALESEPYDTEARDFSDASGTTTPILSPMALPIALPLAPQAVAHSPVPVAPNALTEATDTTELPPLASLVASPDLGAPDNSFDAASAITLSLTTSVAAPPSASNASTHPQPLDFSAPTWPEQMVQDIRQSTATNTDSLTLTLTPERLGTLQIRLEMQDGQTHVHIVTETPEAARAIAEAQPKLAEAMARAGLEMGNQSTGTMGGSGTSGGDANTRNHDQPAADPGTNTQHSEPDVVPTQTTAPRRSSLSSIDLIA
ncbi:flagellar hook-length control protein FliK [Roseovarius sp. MBR-51]